MVKSIDEIEKMRVSGKLTAKVLAAVSGIMQPGVTTLEIDAFCEDYIVRTLHAEPGSKGQYDYPYTVNTSVNNVVCHGWPTNKPLQNGDIVNVDVTVRKNGYYGDSSITFCIGTVSAHAKRLVDITQHCLYRGILAVRPGATTGDIGHIIQKHARVNHYSVVREYCGHGIGRLMHEEPQITHYGRPGEGLRLKAGMTFTIEPMINQGLPAVKLQKDNWTVVTKDRRLSAQWEHTILVTNDGFEVLTLRENEQEDFTAFAQAHQGEVQALVHSFTM